MTSLLLCWYAMGWVACGLEFVFPRYGRAGVLLNFIGAPLFIPIMLILVIVERIPRIDSSKQYLWRKR